MAVLPCAAMNVATTLLIDAALRGAVILLMVLLAALMLRDRRGLTAVRLGVALAFGLALQVLASAPDFESGVPRVYGMSAGGHTALSLAGGRWSPALLYKHCEANLADDFQACVGLATQLTGGWVDGLKKWVAIWVMQAKFADDTALRQHRDPRIAAVVAGVPAAADFDPSSLAKPSAALALVTARQDVWLHPQFHSSRILAACLPRCEHLADLPRGGHGAYLSPLPPGITGLEGQMLNDPPGFDRAAELPAVESKIVDFFNRKLLSEIQGATLVRSTG